MSDPNSQKERPTSSKLEVRIPQATNSEEQIHQTGKVNSPHDDVGAPIIQTEQHDSKTTTNTTEASEEQPEPDSPAADSQQTTNRQATEIQDTYTTRRDSETSKDENRVDKTSGNTSGGEKDLENTAEEFQEKSKALNSQSTGNNQELNVESEATTEISNDEPNVIKESQESKAGENLEESANQQPSSNDKNENNGTNANQSKSQTPGSPISSDVVKLEGQSEETPDRQRTKVLDAASEDVKVDPTQEEGMILDPLSDKHSPNTVQLPDVDNTKPDTNVSLISNSNKGQYPQPSSEQNTDELHDKNQQENIETNQRPQTEGKDVKGQTRSQSRAQSTSSQRVSHIAMLPHNMAKYI